MKHFERVAMKDQQMSKAKKRVSLSLLRIAIVYDGCFVADDRTENGVSAD